MKGKLLRSGENLLSILRCGEAGGLVCSINKTLAQLLPRAQKTGFHGRFREIHNFRCFLRFPEEWTVPRHAY